MSPSPTGDVTSGDFVMPNQAIQAGFQVNGAAATYTIASGELLVKVPDTGAGDVSVSNDATLEVGANGTLTAARARITYYGGVAGSTVTAGTLRIAGQATFSTQMGLSMDNYTVDLAGGTMTTPSVRTFHGLTVSEASTPSVLKAPDGLKMSVSGTGTNSALAGAGDLTLQGTVDLSATITTAYTGELTAAANSTVTLGENRPKLSVVEDATVNITPTAEEQASGRIAFGTSMTADPNNATFKVSGVESVSAEVADGTLTLKWKSAMPTLATTSACHGEARHRAHGHGVHPRARRRDVGDDGYADHHPGVCDARRGRDADDWREHLRRVAPVPVGASCRDDPEGHQRLHLLRLPDAERRRGNRGGLHRLHRGAFCL